MHHDNPGIERIEAAWAALDQRLTRQDDLLLQQARRDRVQSLRRKLRPLQLGQWAQILLGAALIALGASVWPSSPKAGYVFYSAIALHAYGVVAVGWSVATLVLLAKLDYAAPVLELQARMLRLQRMQMLGAILLGLSWWLLWIPAAIVVFAWLGGDYPAHVGSALPAMVLLCLGGFAGTLVAGRWAWDRPRLRGWMRRTLLGDSLAAAGEELDALQAMQHG
jgi:serine/threonine-protein kinase